MCKILAVIPARGGSKEIPRKNIFSLSGKPLIEYTFDVAKGSKLINRIIITTDDNEIAELGKRNGIDVPFMRPKELAEDNTPTLPVIRHAVEFMGKEHSYKPDIVMLLQPTAPLRKSHHIDEALGLLMNNPDADSVVSVTEVPHQYNPYFVMKIEKGLLKFYNEDAIKYTRRQSLPKVYSRNGAIYAFRLETLNEKNSLYGDTCLPYVMSFEESANIDTMYDLMMAEMLLRNR
ncbi:MAG: acylneuraminate cytidylyltransferase family protein [Deltaproteobacteria bacterium]|jgi:CMP-N-acetylneuraminic acid synthetase|nr:MAG: acylneuraminate cytidylyltransferase family protein [Deltaproteobacteria bacterium]